MKTRQKKAARKFLSLRAKKTFKYQTPLVLLFVALFSFTVSASTNEQEVVISKVLYNPTGADNKAAAQFSYELVELKNISKKAVDVSRWEARLGSYLLLEKIVAPIPPGGKVIILGGTGEDKNLDFSAGKEALLYRNKTGSQLGDSRGEVALYSSTANNRDTIVDYVAYGKDFSFSSSVNFLHAQEKKLWKDEELVFLLDEGCAMVILEKKKADFSDWQADCGVEKEKEVDAEDVPKKYSDSISITELFPNPFASQYVEYVELYNGTAGDIALGGWSLHDSSKKGNYIFAESAIIKAKKYLAIFRKDFKFALNNAGTESVVLFDPNGKEVSRANYNGSKKNISYNFDGVRWRWSGFLTPGEKNSFNNEPTGKIKIAKDIFVNSYADFFIATGDSDNDNVKVSWDFGDGHRSSLTKTRHKYLKKGIYKGSVKISDGIEDVIQTFEVEVGKVPHPKVRIIEIMANPTGQDAGVEFLLVENSSNEKLNLNGWSIATGWKDFVNHPIREDVIVGKNKTKKLTSKVASFTLNNSKSRIQLRYPDGKVAHEVKYSASNKTIAEDEKYLKVVGGWEWRSVDKKQLTGKKESVLSSAVVTGKMAREKSAEEAAGEQRAFMEIKPAEDSMIKKENKLLAGEDSSVKIALLKKQPRALGAETVREVDGQYFFVFGRVEPEHYARAFFRSILLSLNLKLNIILNQFFK